MGFYVAYPFYKTDSFTVTADLNQFKEVEKCLPWQVSSDLIANSLKFSGQFGPSKLTKLIFTKDRMTLFENYKKLLQEPFDRVIVNHGEILENQGKSQLRIGVEHIFGLSL